MYRPFYISILMFYLWFFIPGCSDRTEEKIDTTLQGEENNLSVQNSTEEIPSKYDEFNDSSDNVGTEKSFRGRENQFGRSEQYDTAGVF